jgi:carboxymethylenebutenolidase
MTQIQRRLFLIGALACGWSARAAVEGQTVTYPGQGGTQSGYLALPELGDGRGVILVPGIFGLSDQLKEVALRLAKVGYLVLIPDLYGRLGGTAALPLRSIPEASNTVQQLGDGQIVSDLDAAFSYLEQQLKGDGITPRVALLGFGWGGTKALLYATENEELKGVVDFDGLPPEPLERLKQLHCPLLGNFAQALQLTEAVTVLSKNGKSFDFKSFPESKLGFFDDTGPTYDKPSADQAWERTLTFLKRVLANPAT